MYIYICFFLIIIRNDNKKNDTKKSTVKFGFKQSCKYILSKHTNLIFKDCYKVISFRILEKFSRSNRFLNKDFLS